ncbi:HTH_Tnp_Tc3_2 domain-containing protein [Trichonephila clavipes]|nr:HTH_Tnp_Tc3_2 domain-containing protein [Trichonephila clavipes]
MRSGICVAVTAKRSRRSTALDMFRQFSSTTGTTVSRPTVYRCLGHVGLYARRFSLLSDSRRTLIWRDPGTRYYQENTIVRVRARDTVTVVKDGSFWEELFSVSELTCMFRV